MWYTCVCVDFARSRADALTNDNQWRACRRMKTIQNRMFIYLFDLGGAGLRTELKHIIKCRKRNQMGFPQ